MRSWQASDPGRWDGQVVASGACVSYVEVAANCPNTAHWRRGSLVRGRDVPPGTVIATFGPNGRYENRSDGGSHAAILLTELEHGLVVWDQWVRHPVAVRTIRFRGGQGVAGFDGDRFCVVETP